ncbi:transcription initiation factor TFIID subunit 12-like [Vespula squamosa]|uniref:Transcription initiation factor TFIID subunit 12-like n=1 Tax=Vespula squamosa TaxID=30214 RepID=A0ABD2BGM5_VESSQ
MLLWKMRFSLVTCLLVIGLSSLTYAGNTEESSDITKLEVVELSEAETDNDAKESDVQIKRDSGYSYNRPNTRSRFQSGQLGYRGRFVTRIPSQINRPFNKYGPPSHQNLGLSKPNVHGQQHRDKFQHHGQSSQHRHPNNQHSNNFPNHGNGLWDQGIPSPIRNLDFAEVSPIASQNNEPFGSNTANYLPPRNQKLPAYSPADNFSPQHAVSTSQSHHESHNANFQNQNVVQSQGGQISDAALFLSQNAQALQQLYGAAATNQDFAPNTNDFVDQNNQIQNPSGQLQHFENTSPNPQIFRGPLPSYASGTLNPQETLEHIQSLEKDRLIAQLQQALAQSQVQSPNTEVRYAQNHGNYPQNQDLLASIGTEFPPLGTTTGPIKFPLGYGLTTTTTQSPGISATTTIATSTGRPIQTNKGDGTTQIGVNVPVPVQPGTAVVNPLGFPLYGGFVPTFVANVPSYGVYSPGAVTPIQSSGSSSTHFGIPIPTDQGNKGIQPQLPPKTPPSTSQPGVVTSTPVQPVHPTSPLHPVATPIHPVLPATPTHVQPSVGTTPNQHPTYGLQTPLINPLIYKPIKPVYPVYYYSNLAYQLQKPTLPTYPWSYAPSYVSAKPAQIWK